MTNNDFLLELLSEEIPARMQAKARNDLARLFAEELAKAGLSHQGIVTWSTPRRLALVARGVPGETEAVREELKGPRSSAPPQALDGFLRKTGLTREQLEERDGVFFAVIDKPGRPAADVLGEAVATIVRDFPWPKSMRWGAASASMSALRWVRPLHSIVAILGEEIVPVAIEGVTGASPAKVGTGFASGDATTIKSGATTLGHRFHHPGPITIGGAFDYAEKLRACHVIVDHEEREAIVRDGAREAASAAGLALVEDDGLVVENAGLTEWPVPLLGRFDPDFLDVPREVIVLTMRTNQKYFACTGEDGGLAPAFVCTANIAANDGGAAIVEGNRRVLAARLSDARFFWEQDLKVPLEEQATKLSGIVFHEKLGTVADKVERVAKLARWLVEEGIVGTSLSRSDGEGDRSPQANGGGAKAEPSLAPPSAASASATSPSLRNREELADLAERAARLAKADLVTGMVGEFPELQGIIGGYLAAAQGETREVSDAIRDHYKPVGQGDEVPTAPVTVAVSLADKLDTFIAYFAIGEIPTGSKDPFAIRRAALGFLTLLTHNRIRVSWLSLLEEALKEISFSCGKAAGFKQTAEYGHYLRALDWRPSEAMAILQGHYKDGPASREFAEKRFGELSKTFSEAPAKLESFLQDRLKVQQREVGTRHDLIDAVFSLGGEDDFVRMLARVRALQDFVKTDDGRNLLVGYKRAANILKKETWIRAEAHGHNVALAERILDEFLSGVQPSVRSVIRSEEFDKAMIALAALRVPIDNFFESVTVNDADLGIRARRLNLLDRFRETVHGVADFSKIEG